MKQEIKYKGYSAVPSDYECLDGELATMTNLIYEDAALKPIPAPLVEQNFSARRVNSVWVRETTSFKHYIYHFGDSLYYRVAGTEGDTLLCYIGDNVSVYNLEFVGNTLVAVTSSGLFYILWDEEEQKYDLLGNGIPECPISFGLQATLGEEASATFAASTTDADLATSSIMAQANKVIAEQTSEGRFLFPFFVRYAYRLYDGVSLSHHSAPILMFPSTTEGIFARCPGNAGIADLYYRPCELDYLALLSSSEFENLKRWKDVIKSVDIFISAPIYTYDQNGKVKILSSTSGIPSYTTDSCSIAKGKNNIYYRAEGFDAFSSYHRLPCREIADIEEDVKNCSRFYLVRSIPIENLNNEERTILHLDDLSNLVVREMMTDDYQTHDTLIAKFSQIYNGRLNIANLQRKLFKGYDLASMVCFRDEPSTGEAYARVLVPTAQGSAMLIGDTTDRLTLDSHTFSYVFYPDMSAYGMNIILDNFYFNTYELETHPFLNGALHFKGFPVVEQDPSYRSFEWKDGNAEPIINIPNKIYTSEVNNPFYFPLNNINTISTGEIFGIRSAAKPLSEGQYGNFPLYAFTSEGVWALAVTPTGGYNAIQPVIEDVCLGPESIVQMDDSVAFASQRGIILLSGSNGICISDALKSEYPFQIGSMPYFEHYNPNIDLIPFTEFLKNCGMVWDYFHQRLILFGVPNYSYVFSLESKSWGIMSGGNYRAVRSYPKALALDNNGFLYNFSAPIARDVNEEDSDTFVFAVSRPLKLAEADALKQVTSVIQRGYFRKGAIQSILYGSRDLFNWHLIASSKDHYLRGFRGTPYKYFRVVITGNLKDDEMLSGCSIDFDFKQTNHTR